MELRGSIDRSRNFISQDYFYNSKFEISKGRILIERLNIPNYYVNFNFRELQSQYIDGIMRNTQYRINLKWYLKNIGIMNEYKKDLYEIGTGLTATKKEGNVWYFDYEDEVVSRESNLIDERINYYLNKIFGKNLSNKEIVKMRQELEFDATPNSVRDNTLVKLIQLNYPDECVACKDDYDISDRSFKKKNSDRYYFEVHHVISIGKDKELDDENNLVKLCPTCHDLLKRGRASEKEQKDLIRKIFKNAPNTLEFAKNFFNTDDYEEIVQKTYQNLK